ncbi:FAD:protein FMN transferase [Antarcticibacterium arcticum]|uniref:FAD:protein FMN transferase n=1 Tax=Antarcticibacterium arcticum TaxID=2585771 RepID=A0A5B8YEM6_9FLAO|nr:FAD:protein FMN transferase [Antarcticibacterium arcticum]QED36244.1 FAD:protein FMN transferase [Antarcticibacterium arcticum]
MTHLSPVTRIILLTLKAFRKYYKGLVFLLLAVLLSCNPSSQVNEQVYRGEALGTTYQVKFFHTEKLDLQKGLDSIFKVINTSMSTYQADSDISRINSGDTTIVVDENFREVFNYSQQIFNESNGFFDPTVGKLVNAYGFGPEAGKVQLSKEMLDSIKQFVGFQKVELTRSNHIKKEHPGIYLDFNAIAKGYTVDVIARYLDSKNVNDYLLELGGELVAKGVNQYKEEAWAVGIDTPMEEERERELYAAVKLENRAMATSGNYRKFRIDSLSGQRFVHTINPITGFAEKSNLLSASVLAENCTLADGYATAFMALGLEKSIEMAQKLENVEVYLIYTDEENKVKTYITPGFESSLLAEN